MENLKNLFLENSTARSPIRAYHDWKARKTPIESCEIEPYKDGHKVTVNGKAYYARLYDRNDRIVWGLDEISDCGEFINKSLCDIPEPKHPKRTTGPKITQDMAIEDRIKIYQARYQRGEYMTCWDEMPETCRLGGYSAVDCGGYSILTKLSVERNEDL